MSTDSSKPKNFLSVYLDMMRGTEVPETFAIWAGLMAASVSLGRRVWIDQGFFVYPNMMVVLVAKPGRCRKSTAVNPSKRLVRSLEPPPKIIPSKVTVEAFIEAMAKPPQDGKTITGGDSVGYLYADELTTFLNRDTYRAGLGSILTTLWDCDVSFEYETIARGTTKLRNTLFGMLAATTIDWIKTGIPEEAIGQGLSSRILFIYVDKRPPPVAFPKTSGELRSHEDFLTKELHRMAALQGEFVFTSDARAYYEEQYNSFYNTSPLFHDKYLSAYASRRHIHLMKIAMIASAVEGNSREITKQHLDWALWFIHQAETSLPVVMNLITSTKEGDKTSYVLSKIRELEPVSELKLSEATSHRLDVRSYRDIIQMLLQSGQVQTIHNGHVVEYVTRTWQEEHAKRRKHVLQRRSETGGPQS